MEEKEKENGEEEKEEEEEEEEQLSDQWLSCNDCYDFCSVICQTLSIASFVVMLKQSWTVDLPLALVHHSFM